MRLPARTLTSLSSACLFCLAIGCEGRPQGDTSTTEATVKGVVRIAGQLAKEGEIMFDPTNIDRKHARVEVAKINADGTYEAKTLTGWNTVSLSGSIVKKKPFLERLEKRLQVKSGENTFDFETATDK